MKTMNCTAPTHQTKKNQTDLGENRKTKQNDRTQNSNRKTSHSSSLTVCLLHVQLPSSVNNKSNMRLQLEKLQEQLKHRSIDDTVLSDRIQFCAPGQLLTLYVLAIILYWQANKKLMAQLVHN